MTMASYKYGKPIMVDDTPGVAYSTGDVVIRGGVALVAHEDNPAWSGDSLKKDALAAGGGVYTVAADGTYAVGTRVYWNTSTSQVTGTFVAGTTYPFGTIVGGPTGDASDGGPTGSGVLCDVLHKPDQPVPGLPFECTFTIAAGGTQYYSDVTVQLKDGYGNNVATPQDFDLLLSDAASGAGLTATTASGGISLTTGTSLAVLTSAKALRAQSNATGAATLQIIDSAKTAFYVVVSIGGQTFVSRQLTSADYHA